MDINFVIGIGAVIFALVYVTQLPPRRLRAFGNFLKDVLGVLPITRAVDAYFKIRDSRKD